MVLLKFKEFHRFKSSSLCIFFSIFLVLLCAINQHLVFLALFQFYSQNLSIFFFCVIKRHKPVIFIAIAILKEGYINEQINLDICYLIKSNLMLNNNRCIFFYGILFKILEDIILANKHMVYYFSKKQHDYQINLCNIRVVVFYFYQEKYDGNVS